jgi:hypothetical protein
LRWLALIVAEFEAVLSVGRGGGGGIGGKSGWRKGDVEFEREQKGK